MKPLLQNAEVTAAVPLALPLSSAGPRQAGLRAFIEEGGIF
jgi:hypothetical protein